MVCLRGAIVMFGSMQDVDSQNARNNRLQINATLPVALSFGVTTNSL